MIDTADHAKLTHAMARLVACKKQLHEQREAVQKHASAHLDTSNEEVRIASEHLRDEPNALTYRYARTRITENARLRGMALRAEADRADDDR